VFPNYRIVNQVGAGCDGVSYRARNLRTDSDVVLVALAPDLAAPHLMRPLVRRCQLARLLTHPTARRILELSLDSDPPFLTTEPASDVVLPAPRSGDEALTVAIALTAGLAEAHRMGLVHGGLGWDSIAIGGRVPAEPRIDWLGLDVETPATASAPRGVDSRVYLAPERRQGGGPSPPDDVFALATWLDEWLSRRSGAANSQFLPDGTAALDAIFLRMRGADPAERPTAAQAVASLGALVTAPAPDFVQTGAFSSIEGNWPPGAGSDSGRAGAWPGPPSAPSSSPPPPPLRGKVETPIPTQLGRFKVGEKLGEGGMGVVYRGKDLADGTTVAIKVLRGAWVERPDAVKRFTKEARILATIKTPYVVNYIELNEDDGIHYLVLEYVQGPSLRGWLPEGEHLEERLALTIIADVARGLSVAHEQGIIHRDIKPDNILLVDSTYGSDPGSASGLGLGSGSASASRHETRGKKGWSHIPFFATARAASAPSASPPAAAPLPGQVKLSDFGLARHTDESESLLLTQTGAIMGTPLYMAPEQSLGAASVGPTADVYSLGATLFHLLTGRPPFQGTSAFDLIAKLRSESPPAVDTLNSAVSEGACQVVAKALAKRPEERYRDAGEMLRDLDRLLRGEPTSLVAHPLRPACDPRDLVRYQFRWELASAPRQLWPSVSNTERLNRALGLPAVTFHNEFDAAEGVKRFGQFQTAGLEVSWREQPYEWIEGQRMGVLREFSRGPFRWFVSIVEMTPRAEGGTTLEHTILVAAKGRLGRLVAALKIGRQGRRGMDRVYRRIDAALSGRLGRDPLIDPFEPPPPLSREQTQRLERWTEAIGRRGIEPLVAERIGDFLALAPAQDVARIRPLALARRLGVEADQVVTACLHGAHDGVLTLLWDILCPICRIPSQYVNSLADLGAHGNCEACHLDFDLDFGRSVELIFRAHPEIRESDLGTYCIGGPAHSPHVVAQVRVGPGERLVLNLALEEGRYRLRGPQLGYAVEFRIEPAHPITSCDLALAHPPDRAPGEPLTLGAGAQRLSLSNDSDREVLVRIERTAPRDDALTAAQASALALFRELFPAETLSAGRFVCLETMTLVVAELNDADALYQGLGDARAFTLIHEQFQLLSNCLRTYGGAPVKTLGEAVVASFSEPVAAVRGSLELSPALAAHDPTRGLKLRVGIHRGPTLVATINDHLDYFGNTARLAGRLPRFARDGEVVLSPAVASDPGVAAFLQGRQIPLATVPAEIAGLKEGFVHRIGLEPAPQDPE
jgi:serine/threonine protein kinase/class 3 adenylate cyclase